MASPNFVYIPMKKDESMPKACYIRRDFWDFSLGVFAIEQATNEDGMWVSGIDWTQYPDVSVTDALRLAVAGTKAFGCKVIQPDGTRVNIIDAHTVDLKEAKMGVTVTNDLEVYGATVLFSGYLTELARIMGGAFWAILPDADHVVLFPGNMALGKANELAPFGAFSRSIFRYDPESHVFGEW